MDDFDEAPKTSSTPAPRPADVGGIAGEQLRAIIDRIERLEEEKKALAEDIKDVFAEAKGNGFDTKIIRKDRKSTRLNSSHITPSRMPSSA